MNTKEASPFMAKMKIRYAIIQKHLAVSASVRQLKMSIDKDQETALRQQLKLTVTDLVTTKQELRDYDYNDTYDTAEVIAAKAKDFQKEVNMRYYNALPKRRLYP